MLTELKAMLPRRIRMAVSALKPYRAYHVPSYGDFDEAGPWGFLRRLDAVPQRGVIAGYLQHLAPSGRILDVGCGEGLVLGHLGPCVDYVGVDLSEDAIARARSAFGARPSTAFHVADASAFEPAGHFDIIVFNESLYYFEDPAAVVARYERALRPGTGKMIVSMYDAPTTARTWRAIGRGRTAKDGVLIKHRNGIAWEIRLY